MLHFGPSEFFPRMPATKWKQNKQKLRAKLLASNNHYHDTMTFKLGKNKQVKPDIVCRLTTVKKVRWQEGIPSTNKES